MKASKLREMSSEELKIQEDDLTKQLFHLRFQLGAGQLESARKIAPVRKDLARIKTIRNEMRKAAK
jgi:large subunit ribosomal protein L29